jgi:predicted permease
MRLPFWRRKVRDEELEEEIQSHLRMAARDRMERGEAAEEAQESARREFGNIGLVKEVTREMWGWRWLEQLGQDLQYGIRMLMKKPGFTLIIVITLALGIGANTTIFSVVNAVLLKPLPYRDPDRLVRLLSTAPNGTSDLFSLQEFDEFRKESRAFENLSADTTQSVNLTGIDQPDRVRGAFVSADFFETFKIAPFIGRAFAKGEDEAGAERVVIVSHSLWQTRLNGDPNLEGKRLILNDHAHSVIGVLPPTFKHPLDQDVEVWITAQYSPMYRPERTARYFYAFGYLKPGTSLDRAQVEVKEIANRMSSAYPVENANRGARLEFLREIMVRGSRPALQLLVGAVGLILLIACANVANLLLSRGAARQKELAVRAALGGSRGRLIRQLLTETMLLSLLGGGLGLLIAAWGVGVLWPSSKAKLDAITLGFTFGVSLLSGILFGIAPAFQLADTKLQTALKEGGNSSGEGAYWSYARGLFVVLQVALSLTLLIGSGLLIRSFYKLLQVDLGFEPENILTMEYRLPRTRYGQSEAQWNFHRQVVERINEVPGVKSAALIRMLPLGQNSGSVEVVLPDRERPPTGSEPTVLFNTATPSYFETMGISLLRGRLFNEQDAGDRPRVFLVNPTLARRFWPNEDPIGKQIGYSDGNIGTIIGIVGDSKQRSLTEAQSGQLYAYYGQIPGIWATIVVRTAVEPMGLSKAIREAVWKVDPDQPMWAIRTAGQLVDSRLAGYRSLMILMGVFAALALVLAVVGVYGVVSYVVSQCTREIGIRMALGAQGRDVLRLVIGEGMKPVLIGVVLGLLAALGLTQWIKTMLYDVHPADPATFVLVAALLTIVALLACWGPARRATKIDPLVALRSE